jgi:hypothetical protein
VVFLGLAIKEEIAEEQQCQQHKTNHRISVEVHLFQN